MYTFILVFWISIGLVQFRVPEYCFVSCIGSSRNSSSTQSQVHSVSMAPPPKGTKKYRVYLQKQMKRKKAERWALKRQRLKRLLEPAAKKYLASMQALAPS